MPRPAPRPTTAGRRALLVALALLVAAAAWLAVAAAWRLTADGAASGPGRGAEEPAGPVGPHPADDAPAPSPPATPAPTPTPSPEPPTEARFRVLAAGDVLPHLAVIGSARTPTGYDFGPLLAPLDRWVQGADLALCHLEVPVAPDGTEPSGYPAFGAPRELVTGLAARGWDGCSTASNHALDRGVAGAVATLDAMDAAGLGHVGTARSAAEAAAPQLYRLVRSGQSVTVAHLAATYGLNGAVPPSDAPWVVTMLDPHALAARAAAARAEGADVVLVSVHCCAEYVTAPDARQVEAARVLAASGAVDLVIGHHAHVPQPVERLAGGPDGTGMWVLHGLGNMLSNQDAECCVPETSSGVVAVAEVVKPVGGPARVAGVGWTGTTVDRAGGHRVHALPDVVAGTPTLPAAEVAGRAQGVAAAVGTAATPLTTPPVPTGAPPVVVTRDR